MIEVEKMAYSLGAEPVFCPNEHGRSMTKREYFTSRILQSLIIKTNPQSTPINMINEAAQITDALLKRLSLWFV
jgi:hypothetical protein